MLFNTFTDVYPLSIAPNQKKSEHKKGNFIYFNNIANNSLVDDAMLRKWQLNFLSVFQFIVLISMNLFICEWKFFAMKTM